MMNQRHKEMKFINHIFVVTLKVWALFLPFILVLVTGFIFSDWVSLLAVNENIISFLPFILFFFTTIFLFNYRFWLGVFYDEIYFDSELEKKRQESEIVEVEKEVKVEKEVPRTETNIKYVPIPTNFNDPASTKDTTEKNINDEEDKDDNNNIKGVS